MLLPSPELDVGWGLVVVLDDNRLALWALVWEVVDVRQRRPKWEAELVQGCDPKEGFFISLAYCI